MAGYKSKVGMLKKSFDSIKKQTYSNIEVVFVNDGCDDESINFIQRYKEFFTIKLIHNDMNMGLAKSLNNGLNYSDGKYIARFDDDDIMMPDRIEKQVEFMEQNSMYAGCWSEYQLIDQGDNVIGMSHIHNLNFIKRFVTRGNCCCHSSLFLKKEILVELNGYNESYLYAQDMELYMRILESYKMYCLKEYLVQFRENRTRNTLDKILLSFVYSYAAALKYAIKAGSLKIKLYLMVRILVMIKFTFFDIWKLNGKISKD
jgi:glycosyltransferase EpsE